MGACSMSLGAAHRPPFMRTCVRMTKVAERVEARRLRHEDGASIKVIASRLRVAPATVSRWVRDIPLTPEQLAVLYERDARSGGRRAGHARQAAQARAARLRWQNEGRELAPRREGVELTGCMFHWGEGPKETCRGGNAQSGGAVLDRDSVA